MSNPNNNDELDDICESLRRVDMKADDAKVDVKTDAKADDAKTNDAKADDAKVDAKADDAKVDAKADDAKVDAKDDDAKTNGAKADDAKVDAKADDAKTGLLDNPEVIKWLHGDLTFLNVDHETMKSRRERAERLRARENEWGRAVMKRARPDLRLEKQWTNLFGEILGHEMFQKLHGVAPSRPRARRGMRPDLETATHIVEIKTQTYFTTGTAAEKILGCVLKYASIPRVFGKPLRIVCIGAAEKIARETYGIISGGKRTPEIDDALAYHRDRGVEYVAFTDLLRELRDSPRNSSSG